MTIPNSKKYLLLNNGIILQLTEKNKRYVHGMIVHFDEQSNIVTGEQVCAGLQSIRATYTELGIAEYWRSLQKKYVLISQIDLTALPVTELLHLLHYTKAITAKCRKPKRSDIVLN